MLEDDFGANGYVLGDVDKAKEPSSASENTETGTGKVRDGVTDALSDTKGGYTLNAGKISGS